MRDVSDIVHGQWPHPGNVVSGDGGGAKHGGAELLLHGSAFRDRGTPAHTDACTRARVDAGCNTGAR